ncbi:MAG: SDR family oxidoreductase [Planctomycetaceae bacterium]|jgi:nucleoside-diphosphate-sugar epimerase|nr:SDR family oxidoreductase [Planctomycetaceae bacterium]
MTKKYHFLTGSTGLLGSYILGNLSRRDYQLAVLVRPSKRLSAEHRIDKIMTHWETEYNEVLPRPVVISGDLSDKDWCCQHRDWFSQHCQSVIHCAASLVFYGSADDEPWISNVEGTRSILELCRETGIDNLHYFSTAYIAGSSKKFYEHETDIGQALRNDYEQSKLNAEKMVRAANHIRQLTVYRPSIVVGDSRTAFTTTFHGFYAVLKLAHTLVQRLPFGSTSGRNLLTALGMNGSERKNFVPVDWVADIFEHIFSNSDYHGQTYHLTSPEPPLATDFVDIVQDAVETFSTLADKTDPQCATEEWFFQNYLDQVQIYRAYLQDDPRFDSKNTQRAVPHLPCPRMDRELMLFLARYAILSQFGKRKPVPDIQRRQVQTPPVIQPFETMDHL